MNIEWIKTAEELPQPMHRDVVSHDMLVMYQNGMYAVANYDHEGDHWTEVPSLVVSDTAPEFWAEIPSPIDHR